MSDLKIVDRSVGDFAHRPVWPSKKREQFFTLAEVQAFTENCRFANKSWEEIFAGVSAI